MCGFAVSTNYQHSIWVIFPDLFCGYRKASEAGTPHSFINWASILLWEIPNTMQTVATYLPSLCRPVLAPCRTGPLWLLSQKPGTNILLQIYDKREEELKKRSLPLECTCFRTSIWDETLYKVPMNHGFIKRGNMW